MLPLLLQLVVLTASVLLDPYISKKNKSLLLIITAIVFSLIFQEQMGLSLESGGTDFQRTFNAFYGYCARPVILVLFIRICDSKNRFRILWVLPVVNAVFYSTAFYSSLSFTFSGGIFGRGPLGYSCHIVSFFLLLFHMAQVMVKYRNIRKPEALIPVLNALLIIGATVLDTWIITDYDISALTVVMVSTALFYYVWLHLQFVREHDEALLSQQRIQIMMSQIQPHFLYNTLSTIQALCRIDPEKASDTLEKFGAYLRQNIDSVEQPDLIPISKELEHTRIYAEIETIRFPHVKTEFEVEDNSFYLPALTVQPLVENAIRHGVRIRTQGIIKVKTYAEDGCHIVVISDNGKGFDINAQPGDGKSHIGIRNVMERVEKLCGGSVTVDSVIDKGTTVTIRIPGQEKK